LAYEPEVNQDDDGCKRFPYINRKSNPEHEAYNIWVGFGLPSKTSRNPLYILDGGFKNNHFLKHKFKAKFLTHHLKPSDADTQVSRVLLGGPEVLPTNLGDL